ncbi:MAG: O-antigen ligase family protein [Oscillospiraceae bacterium]|nr:O-antigen ligase family protein [Oscillospiraceae bacterium]
MDLRINGKSIYDSQIFAVILAMVFVEPAYFGQFEVLDDVYTYAQLFFTVFLLILSVIERKWNISSICIYLFFGTILLTTIFGSGNVYEYCATYFPILGMCLMIDLWSKHNVRVLFNAIGILEIYIYINLFTVLLFPDGMYKSELYSHNWFLGYKNPQIRTILPIVSVSLIRSYWEKNRITIRSYVLMICSMLTFVLADSSTALVGFTIFVLLLLLFHQKEKRLPKVFSLINVFIAVVLMFVAILFFGVQNNFAWLIEGVLGRDLTFTTRLTCWAKAFMYIAEKPLFGYGYLSSNEFGEMLGHRVYTHPHNLLLYLGMIGGVALILVFVMIVIFSSIQLWKNSDYIGSKIILFALCCFLVMSITESITSTVLFYPMFVLAMNIDYVREYDGTVVKNSAKKYKFVLRKTLQ